MSAPNRVHYDVAGWYCEHDGLGHTCQSCADVVADVFSAARDAGLELVVRSTHEVVDELPHEPVTYLP